MMHFQCLAIVLSCLAVSVYSASTPLSTLPVTTAAPVTTPSGPLNCRICERSSSLDTCTKLGVCSDDEDCYMDELITEQLTIVYNGGCRAKDVCSGRTPAPGVGKRAGDLIACSRCCSNEKDCNKRLCGIKSSSINATQCYSCNNENGAAQSQVRKPEDCVSLGVCQSDEMCYVYENSHVGVDEFFFGCKPKQICQLLMTSLFENLEPCHKPGVDPNLCIDSHFCHSCCGDGGCNYGSCREMNERLFNLKNSGLLNTDTLKANSTSP